MNTATTATEVVLPGLVEPAGLVVRERPVPSPGPGEALVRVEATGVSFAEKGMRRGRYPGQPAFPFVPGYDLVGTVTAVGTGVDQDLVGRRVAALTKTGGWTTHLSLPAVDLLEVPAGVDPAEAESVIVNGVTAWQMLHRTAKVRPGQTVLVHGASGGVGSLLVQLARLAGVSVVGTASPRHHEVLRSLGVQPVDYHDPDLEGRLRQLAPGGYAAVFDHLGGASVSRSRRLLGPGGTLVCYGTATQLDSDGSVLTVFAGLLTKVVLWQVLPNKIHATFYNLWAGARRRDAFRARLHADLGTVLGLVRDGELTAYVAARFPLTEVAAAMELAEAGGVLGKVVLVP